MTLQHRDELDRQKRLAVTYARISFFANLCLLAAKVAAAILTGSLSVVTSVIDSVVDLLSGILIWYSNRKMLSYDRYQYPKGRSKLEPLVIVVLACVMACASVQMIIESIKRMILYVDYDVSHQHSTLPRNCSSEDGASGPSFEIDSIIIFSVTIVVKLCLYLMCRKHSSAGVKALAQDHLNDVLSNSVAIAGGLLGHLVWKYADPIGAIVISLYIIISLMILELAIVLPTLWAQPIGSEPVIRSAGMNLRTWGSNYGQSLLS